MKKVILVSLIGLGLFGCATKGVNHTPLIQAPSGAKVKSDISSAQQHNDKLKSNLDKSSDYSKRIDNKATVILEHWNG